MDYPAQAIFLILGGHDQGVQEKVLIFERGSFAGLAKAARINDKFFAFRTNLKRKNLHFSQAIFAKPNIVCATRKTIYWEEGIQYKYFCFL